MCVNCGIEGNITNSQRESYCTLHTAEHPV